jgi:hypothetical protein
MAKKKTRQTEERRRPLARPDAVVQHWRTRNGYMVPGIECLPPIERVSVRQFCALMEAMIRGCQEVAP